MKSNDTFWRKMGLHDFFLKKEEEQPIVQLPVLTPDDVYKYIVQKFNESIVQLSFANRIVFFHEYIICFNPDDYNEFMNTKRGIFGIIVHESVKHFYDTLKTHRLQGKTVEASGNKWVFRFVSHPDYKRGDKSLIGKLLPGGGPQKEENLRITFIPRQTGVAESFDVNDEILKDFTFYSDGYYEVPFREDLVLDDRKTDTDHPTYARLETIVPDKAFAGKKISYYMKREEIIVSGNDETREDEEIFKIPSEWVSSPHLRIKFSKTNGKFYIASFGDKTMLNEQLLQPSDLHNITWTELPLNSKMVLNGIVGINIFKS